MEFFFGKFFLAKHLKKNREIFDEKFEKKCEKEFRGILILIMSKKINISISIFWDFWQIEFLDKNSTF